MDQENGKRLFKTPKELGVDILDEQGKVVNHVDYGTNGITGLNLQDVYEYTSPEGEKTYYSKEADIPSGVYLDADTGRIKIQVPEKWKDDEKVKSWADSSTLKLISGNYRNNKDVKYPHPYDETKKITTQEYIDYLNNGLKSRIAALEAETPTKMNLIQYFGGDDKKNAAIDSLSAEDVITMSLSYDKDDSWVPLPKYMLAAYPQLKKLSTYKNGFVQKKDFLDNFYNIESGAITERYAHGIATAPQKVLEKIEDLDADEIAKTVGFSRFISQVDPKRSPISQFLQAGDALARGFYGSLTDWTKDTAELIGNIATFSWATGEKADVSEFMGGLLFGENGFLTPSSTEALAPAMQQMAATNKDALTKAQAGLVQGAIAGKALDMVISTAAINKVANIASNAITNAITSAGGRALGNAMTATRAAEYTTEGLATVSNATDIASTAGTIAANQAILAKAASGSAAYTTFFGQTLSSALYTYSKNIGGMTTYFRAMPTAQFATIVNSAAKIANAATYANTAVGVLGSMVFAAVVNNKELTNKVLSGEATSDEAKDLLRQTLFDTAKVQAASWMLGLNPKIAGLENKLSDKLESINQAMSQFFTGLGAKAASPWIRFMQWLVNNKAAAAAAGGAKLSNAAVARAEALKEVVLLNEAKQYATNLSRVAGTNAPRLLEEALASAGIDIGTSMADTLKKLEEVGYNFDPADLAMSEFEGWQGNMAELRNVLTTWGDINTNVSKVVLEFTNPDIQPTISQQMSEINKADTDLIKAEKEAGLLDAKTYKTDIKLSKQNEGYIYSAHSEELSRYIVRKYEMGVIANEARANGVTDLDNYQPYVEARARYTAAAELVPENIRNIADTKYVPALKKAEHEIINVMKDDGVYPRSFVKAMRAGGKFGTDGNDWLRLVARKDLPKGTYNPYSKTVKRDNTIALGTFNVLEDGDITWPGNGLQELITEYGVARSEKAFLDASKRATGLVTDVKIPGRKTAAAGRIEEFKTDFEKAVKQGFKSFTEDVEGTAAVGNKRANQQREFYNEVATLGGVQTADIEDLRAVMRENDLPMAEDIVDKQTLDKFLTESSDEAKKIMTNAVGEKASDRIVSDYTEKASFRTLEKREKIAQLDSDIAQFKKDVDLYKNSLNWAVKELPDGFSDVQRANAEKLVQSHVEAGKKALERLGYKASPKKFDEWASKKLKKLEEKRSALVDKVLSERGKSRPAVKFEGNLYPGISEQIQYIPNRKNRQKISDDALGVWNGDQGGLANEWLNDGDYEVKPQLRETIEQNPELRNALLSTMYDNSGSKLPFDEWLNTPITLKRQQNVDSLRQEDAFLSFSMNKNWSGIGGLVPRLDNVPGDIVTLEIKPINTLGEIPKGIDAEDELEVIVPREAYATAMSNYDRAMKSDEMKRYEQSIKNMEDEIAELSPVENAQEFIPTLNYQQRKELAQKFADANPEYTVLYRMQGGAPDQWRPNNRGKKGKFEGHVGEMKGAVWLTSNPDWVEGPERATAGVKTSPEGQGEEVTDENIVVIPVKKSDIFDNTYDGGEEYKNDEVLRKKIEDSGKKLIQTRTAEKIEAVNNLQEKGIPPRLMDHTNPENNERTEFILFEQDHPEVLSDGMNLMLEQYNKQFDNPVYRRRIANIQRDIDYSRDNEAISMVLDEALAVEQFEKLEALKSKSPDRYEKLLEKADRANAANNEKVKNSNVVQDAAAEYRKNVKSLEDSTILTEKFSYLAQLPTAKGSLKEFAESNNLQLPEGDGDLKGKVKEALWNMLQEGKDLPSIKGLKKTDYKLDPSKKESYKNIDVDSLLKNPDKGLIVDKKEFFKLLGKTELFRNPAGPNSLKYELNKEDLYNDIDDAIDGMMELIKKNGRANSAIESMVEYTNGNPSETRFEFAVLCEVLSKNGLSTYKQSIEALSHKVVDGAISDRKAIVKGNLRSLYEQVETAIYDKLKSRLAAAKNALESAGETVESETITDLLTQYAKEIGDAEADPFIVKTTNRDGEIQYERVSPAIAGIYNERGVYEPLGTGTKILANLALLKKINTTDLSPRSFMKQAFSDPAMAFATVGALPGSLQALRDEIEAQLGPDVFQALQKVDPARYKNIELIAEREGISLEEALARNLKAIANTEVPFTLLNEEILRQAKVSKYGLKAAKKMNAKNTQDKINSALRKVSDKLGTPQNIRETYVRKLAGETAFLKALRKGYSLHQSEIFRVHAINTATTNFRTKHTMFNKFRSTVPYLTSGISGAKSFWQMFEMDPLGVTSRMFTGFVAPILYFMGEIMSDEEAKKKYEALAESEKDNHIFIKVGSQIIPIPVGEEIGQFSNIAVHLVETLFNENKYGFWSLMLNDLVNLIPGIDLTGFTDPDMWNAITGSPSFPDIIENGIAKVLAGATPPLAQSAFMAATGRDMYTGNRINTAYVDIDDDGNPVIMTSATSQFAKAVANVIGGDAKVIQKVVSGIGGTVLMDVLDTVTSAVQFVGSAGKEGSLTTGVEKFFGNASAPFAANGYDELDRRFSGSITQLWYKKDSIEHGDPNMNQYLKYNQEIAKEKDPERRQLLKNKRNDLLNGFYKEVETLVKNYRDAGGTLDKDKFSKVVSLLTFEDAVRADRQFMDLNTGYSDAYNQAMQTLYDMGIENPDGVSSLGYIYTDKETGKPEIKMWNPVQMQIINDTIWDGGDIHRAQIEAIIDDGTKNSIKNLSKTEKAGEQPFWDKYNATGKLSDKEWDAIDDLREAFNAQVVIALADYMDAYGAVNILSNDAVIDYLEDIIKVPSEYETVKGRNVSSGNGKLNKQQGFAESYIKKIFGVN